MKPVTIAKETIGYYNDNELWMLYANGTKFGDIFVAL